MNTIMTHFGIVASAIVLANIARITVRQLLTLAYERIKHRRSGK